jgi:hypothetical protein
MLVLVLVLVLEGFRFFFVQDLWQKIMNNFLENSRWPICFLNFLLFRLLLLSSGSKSHRSFLKVVTWRTFAELSLLLLLLLMIVFF